MDVGALMQAIAQMGSNWVAGAANASKGSNETVADARSSQPQTTQQQPTQQAEPSESKQAAAQPASSAGTTDSQKSGEDVKKMAQQIGTNMVNSAQAVKTSPTVVSDERLKEIFGADKPIESFGKIRSYDFRYTPQAQEMLHGKDHVDDKEHFGVMAQDLANNELTKSTVIKDADGFLKVDTPQLTMANTAMIAELARNMVEIQRKLGEK